MTITTYDRTGPEALAESAIFLPAIGRLFGSQERLYLPGEIPDIQVVRQKVEELYRLYAPLADFDFVEGFNLRGENAQNFTKARDYLDDYLPYHGLDFHKLPARVASKAMTDYEHYKHHIALLIDGGEQALPTGVFAVNDRVYFNAHVDDRDHFFILHKDESIVQFTGLQMERGANKEEWLCLGDDLAVLEKQGPVIRDGDGLILTNGHWINP